MKCVYGCLCFPDSVCVLVGFLPCIALGREGGGEGERTLIETRGGERESLNQFLIC